MSGEQANALEEMMANTLRVKQGKIVKETRFDNGPMSVIFTKAAIAPTGDLGRIELTVCEGKVEMTYAQGLTFAQEIMRRCS